MSTLTSNLFRILVSSAALAGAASPAAAASQLDAWPVPGSNLVVGDRAGQEADARIAPTADGGFYVSWFDNTDSGWDVRLQRLDASGNEQWAHNGILVADRSYSSTTNYGLTVASNGDAIIALQCCAPGGADRATAFRVAPDGTAVWGASGIPVSAAGEGVLIAYATTTSDGNTVVAWNTASAVLRAQKLDATGAPLWGANGVVVPGPSGVKLVADVQPGLNGDAIVAWSNQSGSTRILRAQKLASADGSALWGSTAAQVATVGNLQAGYFPKIIVDGAGGAVFVYYDAIGTVLNTRVQHLDASGARLLGDTGVVTTTLAGLGHVSPSGVYDPSDNSIYAMWVDRSGAATQDQGLYLQHVDAAGARLWGDNGLELVPMTPGVTGENALSQLVAHRAPGGFIATWVTGGASLSQDRMSSMRVSSTGAFAWSQPVALKQPTSAALQLTVATSTHDFPVYVWSDYDGLDLNTRNIRAQYLPYNGQFSDTIFGHGFED